MSDYSATFPPQRPVFNADFSNSSKIDPRATFSRSDSPIDATKAAASAVHYWSNEKHLSSENLLTHSNDISSAYGKNGLTETGGQTAPDGGTDAYKLTEDSATGFHRIYYASPVLSSGSLTVSCYVKYIGRQWVYIRLRDSGAAYRHVWFDVQNGTKGTEETNMTGTISASGGGYYKLTATVSSVHATSADVRIGGANADGNTQYAGSGSDAFAVWGIQASTTGETVLNETSGQIHREYAPTLKSPATAGAARFEYDPTDGQSAGTSLGCLIEGQSTNLATYGSDLTNAAWNPLSAFIGGTAVGPDGTLSAVKLVASAASSLYPRFRRLSLLTDTTQTFSIYVKPLEFQHLAISADGSTSSLVQYNLSGNGAITSATGATGAVEQCGNGWFRVSFSYTTVPNSHLAITMQSSTTYQTETGNGYDGMLFALAQLENQSFSSSFIGTTSSTATRAADSLTVDLTQAGYTGGPVSVITETTAGLGSYPRTFSLSDGTITNYANIHRNGAATDTSSDYRVRLFTDGASQVDRTATGSASATKIGMSIDTNSVISTFDGGSSATDSSAVINTMTELRIGDQPTGGKQLNGTIKRIAVYGTALSQTELEALTS